MKRNNLIYAMSLLIKYHSINSCDMSKKELHDFYTNLITHCNLVLDCGKLILCKLENISEDLKIKAEIACLLHDIGKFNINKNTNIEHGNEGYDILIKEGISEDIALSVKYHNKYSYHNLFNENFYLNSTNKEKEEIEFLVKLNKDAGELANILDLFFSHKFKNITSRSTVSEKVKTCFLEGKLVDNKNVENDLDFIFMRLSGIFDLNFEKTKDILIGYGLLTLIIDTFKGIFGKNDFEIKNLVDKIIITLRKNE